MKCPWGCGWEGTPEEYPKHLETCSEYQKPSERPGEYTLTDISEDISSILNKINLRFIPRTEDEEIAIRTVKIRLTEASSRAIERSHL